MIFTRKPIPKEGDLKFVVSYCLLPLFWDRKIYWLEKVEKVYEYNIPFFEYMDIYDYNPRWDLKKVKTYKDEVG